MTPDPKTRAGQHRSDRRGGTLIIGALIMGVLLAMTLTLAGCSALDERPPAAGAQSSLPPPVLTHTAEPAAPVSLAVGDASARIHTVDTDNNGVLLPPKDVHELGWWIGSARPGGGTGTVVITGHVDDVDQGAGFAARFTPLKPGDDVDVTTADQSVHRYRVTRNQAVNKEGGLPAAELNRLDGPETLALVTCGGPFIGPPLGYRDNIVVFAVPA